MFKTKITTVLFDMANVLVIEGYDLILNHLSSLYNVPQQEMAKVLKDTVLVDLNRGRITYEEAVSRLERAFGEQRRRNGVSDNILLRGDSVDLFSKPFYIQGRERLVIGNNVEIAKKIAKGGIKVGILSNITESILNYYKDVEFFNGFNSDYLTFSSEDRCAKPDPIIYKNALQRLGSKPEETLFIDDNKEYVKGARKLGINSVQFDYRRNTLEDVLGKFGLII
ncbi:MAG TPA: HAD-IA family hydrolase [Candidatus Nanoarchaeia archaeon]|nr:HAD-IA family hydrolase [Candidatus Nanoarchaeia archaeon]